MLSPEKASRNWLLSGYHGTSSIWHPETKPHSLQKTDNDALLPVLPDPGNLSAAVAAPAGRIVRYQVSPEALAVGAKQAIVGVGYQEVTGRFKETTLGFFAAPGGYVLTVTGALMEGETPMLMTTDGERYEVEIVERDDRSGVVLLKIEQDAWFLPLGDSRHLV